MLCSKVLLIKLADIYEVPELAKAQIKEWPVMEQNLKVLNFNILSILRATKEGNRQLEEKRIQAVLKVFVPIEKKDLEPSKADINALLAKVRKDPFSEDAENALAYLIESIQEYALKFGFKTKGNRSNRGK